MLEEQKQGKVPYRGSERIAWTTRVQQHVAPLEEAYHGASALILLVDNSVGLNETYAQRDVE